MPRYFHVGMHATVAATVYVTVDDDALQRVAAEHEVTVEELTLEMLQDKIRDEAFENKPTGLCIHCSGMGMGSTFSMSLDEFECDDEDYRYGQPQLKLEDVIHEQDGPPKSSSRW